MIPPTCAELNHLWETKFRAELSVQVKETSFACPSNTSMIAQAFYDVLTPQLSYPYYEKTATWVKGTHVDMKCKDSYGYAEGDEIFLCRGFFESDNEERVGTIVHEASHTRHDDPGHVKCTHGEHKGKDDCDEKLHEEHGKGSGYNFELMFYTDLLAANNYNLLAVAVLKLHVNYGLLNNFNEVTPEQMKKWASTPSPEMHRLPYSRDAETFRRHGSR